MQASVRSYVN